MEGGLESLPMKCQCCGNDDEEELVEVTPEIVAAAKAVALVYKHSQCGGNLHCIVDDGNVDMHMGADSWYDFKITGNPTSKAQERAEKKCLDAFEKLTVEQRYATLQVYHNYISEKLEIPSEIDVA